jgi:hypothetical protein
MLPKNYLEFVVERLYTKHFDRQVFVIWVALKILPLIFKRFLYRYLIVDVLLRSVLDANVAKL